MQEDRLTKWQRLAESPSLSVFNTVERATAFPDVVADLKQAEKLLEYALTICMYGERAPGGDENWDTFGRNCEAFLRRDEPKTL